MIRDDKKINFQIISDATPPHPVVVEMYCYMFVEKEKFPHVAREIYKRTGAWQVMLEQPVPDIQTVRVSLIFALNEKVHPLFVSETLNQIISIQVDPDYRFTIDLNQFEDVNLDDLRAKDLFPEADIICEMGTN